VFGGKICLSCFEQEYLEGGLGSRGGIFLYTFFAIQILYIFIESIFGEIYLVSFLKNFHFLYFD
jgi:hypothetical protein